jgi:sulfate permease, SulP family
VHAPRRRAGRDPILVPWRRGYERSWLGPDVLAGVTTGCVVIPQAMGYASVADLPVQVGLATCVVPMLVYALLGGSRRMSVSTTSTIVALTGAGIDQAGLLGGRPEDRVATATTLTAMVGLALLVASVLRMGFLVDAVSETVIVGLKVGVGLTIAAGQLPALLGYTTDADGFFREVGAALRHLDDVDGWTLGIAATTIGVLLAGRRWHLPVPAPLLALVLGIGAVVVFDADDHGVALIAEVPRGLPTPALPPADHLGDLAPYAIAIALMAFLETASVGRATREVDDPPIDDSRELATIGIASTLGACCQAVPAAGGFSQSLVNSSAGARTQLSELVTVALAVLTAFLLAPVLSDLPAPTLAAIVLVAVLGLIDPGELIRVARIDRGEFLLALATGIVALLTNLLVGVAFGVAITFFLVLHRLDHPELVELRRVPGHDDRLLPARAGDPPIPGLLVVRIDGGLYTMNVRRVQRELVARVEACTPLPAVLLVDVGRTADTSTTVLHAFAELDRELTARGTELWAARVPERAVAKIRRTAIWETFVAAGRVHDTVEGAVAAFERDHPARADGPTTTPSG